MSPQVNFDDVPDPEDFSPVPPGRYECRISDVEEATSKNGNLMWNLTLTIEDGEYYGRRIFDRLVFAEKALPRVKLVCQRLGLDTEGTVDLVPSMLRGKKAIVSVEIETYTNDAGEERKRNVVPFSGYIPEDGQVDEPWAPTVTDDDIPF